MATAKGDPTPGNPDANVCVVGDAEVIRALAALGANGHLAESRLLAICVGIWGMDRL